MLRFNDISIRYKITLLMLSVVAIVLAAVCIGNVINEIQSTRESMEAKYIAIAKIVAAHSGVAVSIADIDRSGAQQMVSDLQIEPAIHRAALFDTAGAEIVRHPADSTDRVTLPQHMGSAFTSDGYLDVVESIALPDGTVVGKVLIRANTDRLRNQIVRTVLIAFAVFLGALICALLLTLAVQRLVSAPVLRLAGLMERVAKEHDYSLQAERRGNDELGQLCDGFNTMLAEIRRRDNELDQHRTHLEELVDQRTKVLSDRSEQLTLSNEELTKSRELLQEANKELEAFSYSVSHDLRAPLRAIDGFSRILMEDYFATLPPDAQEYLQDIRKSTQQMGRLVDDLLAFARCSRQPISKREVQPNSLVQLCLEELQSEQNGRSLDIHVDTLPACAADPSLLKQVWTNLLSNAIKYTSVRKLAEINVGGQNGSESGQVTYFVKDNGVGFDMRYVHKLFGVFQRLHKAEEFPGTGVGLAIVQRIIQRHGGRIWVESQPDCGTTFYFTLDGAPSHG